MERCIDVAFANRVELMLENAGQTSERVIDDGAVYGLFGI